MAEANTRTFEKLEDAKAECEKQNAERIATGLGKERYVFDITVQSEHKFYVVATLSGKARAIAALALDIRANVAEKKAGFGTPRKPLVDEVASMKPDELEKLRAILAKMDGPAPAADNGGTTTHEPATTGGRKRRSE